MPVLAICHSIWKETFPSFWGRGGSILLTVGSPAYPTNDWRLILTVTLPTIKKEGAKKWRQTFFLQLASIKNRIALALVDEGKLNHYCKAVGKVAQRLKNLTQSYWELHYNRSLFYYTVLMKIIIKKTFRHFNYQGIKRLSWNICFVVIVNTMIT